MSPRSALRLQEHELHWLLILTMQLLYAWSLATYPNGYFGFNQLRHAGWGVSLVGLLILGGLFVLGEKIERLRTGLARAGSLPWFTRLLLALAVGLVGFGLFLSFRNGFINVDGQALLSNIPSDVLRKGAHVTHDEMWELYLHSRFWDLTNRLSGWSVAYSYQFLSSVAGGVFLAVLVGLSFVSLSDSRLAFVGLMVSAGYMQLFFGDVENYTLVSVWILIYVLFAYLFLSNKVGIVVPSLTLSVAMTFHLLAGWYLPSLAYLFGLAYQRQQKRQILLAVVVASAWFGATLAFFHFNHLPILDLFTKSNAFADGGHYLRYLTRPYPDYLWALSNLVFLLFPSLLIFLPLVVYRRIHADPFNTFLVVSALSWLAFTFVWRAQLGVYQDWNLFAPGMIPLAVLCWHNFVRVQGLKHKRALALAWMLSSGLHSYAWIIANHWVVP